MMLKQMKLNFQLMIGMIMVMGLLILKLHGEIFIILIILLRPFLINIKLLRLELILLLMPQLLLIILIKKFLQENGICDMLVNFIQMQRLQLNGRLQTIHRILLGTAISRFLQIQLTLNAVLQIQIQVAFWGTRF